LLGFIVSASLGALTLYLSRGRLFPTAGPREDVKAEELEALKSDEKLTEALLEISRNCRGLILLVDDAQWLPVDERRLLVDLCAPPESKLDLRRFTERYRVLIVTLESQVVDWGGRPEEAVAVLDVPTFTAEQVGRIAWTQLGEEFALLDEVERESLLGEGQEHIANLFARRAAACDEEIGRLFEVARGAGYPDAFDQKDVMVFWAVSHRSSVGRSEMRNTLESLQEAGHLEDFGLRPVADTGDLVSKFPATTLAYQDDQTYHFDVPRCQALGRVLDRGLLDPRGPGHGEGRHLLARAHYGWFRLLSGRCPARSTEPVSLWSEEQRQALREAVWHVIRIGSYLDRPADVLAKAAGLDAGGLRERRYEVAERLLDAADSYWSEGNTTEADDLVVDGAEWLPAGDAPRSRRWLERAAGQLWRHFWLSGRRAGFKHLRALLRRWPALRATPTWRINRRYERLLHCRRSLGAATRTIGLSAELLNLSRLTQTLCGVRRTHGLIGPALQDRSIDFHEAAGEHGHSVPEVHLRELHAAALAARGDGVRLATSLRAWKARLESGARFRRELGEEAIHCYSVGRYWHTLADVAQFPLSPARIDEDEAFLMPGEAGVRVGLLEAVDDFYLAQPPEGVPPRDFVWQEAQSAYERARQLATFLYWRPLLMEACFQEGELLREHTPEARRREVEGGKPWWWRWDKLFWQSINLEREAGWIVNTPVMHRNRWEFFSSHEDNEGSVEEAYNALRAVKRAGYPLPLILDWHNQVRTHLINHSDSDEDRRRDAEMNEEWAHALLPLPEARRYWRPHDSLELVQASALHFAAQARRLVKELDRADELLDRADALVEASVTTVTKGPEPGRGNLVPEDGNGNGAGGGPGAEHQTRLRDLKISLRIQRAWLRKAQDRNDEYCAAVYGIWQEMRADDGDSAVVLGSLAEIEHHQKVLGTPWPAPGMPPHVDPDSPGMSLPEEWFTAFHLPLNNRYEFRLYQLLNTVNCVERAERFGLGSELARVPSVLGLLYTVMRGVRGQNTLVPRAAPPDLLFSTEMLKMVAMQRWLGIGRFAEISRSYATYGLTYGHAAETRAMIVNLLDAARFYFAEVERVDSEELETLRLLMEYEPDSPRNFRLEYVRVLIKHKHLLDHERLSLQAAEATDWYAAAQRIHKYLHVLVDDELLDSCRQLELQARGLSAKSFYNTRTLRRDAMQAALSKYDAGESAVALEILNSALPSYSIEWVLMEDLQVLHLWLECAKSAGAMSNEVAPREADLRSLALRYVRQFKLVIKEEEVRQLVSGILIGLHDPG
jgi:hypothetical protein